MRDVRHFKVDADNDGQRLDRWIKANVPDLSYGLAQKLMRKGQIRVDGKRAKPDMRLSTGQDIRIPMPDAKEIAVKKQTEKKRKLSQGDIDFIRSLVIFDDGDVIALNKPAGLAVQGGTKTSRHVDGMLEGLKNKSGVVPRLVHRLDKDTSGVLLLARSAEAARKLGEAFKGRNVKKIYWTLVSPTPEMLQGTIRAAIVKGQGGKKEKMLIDDEHGKSAVTEYAVLESAGKQAAFVAFWPRTGRTHQIRVHAQLMGSPIIGDGKYKSERPEHEKEYEHIPPEADFERLGLAKRLHLHARRIILPHPLRKSVLDIAAPLPPDLVKSWKTLGFTPNIRDNPFEDMD
ncbi:MAG: RluA family pseudouridine synthase [Alphaproteobacteria bacterium]|nr:RluA family pseudouridine synthase [Alphaproteobacteria bacterium]MCB9974322.1 RluA family pseudouridine synthase [Rhodospirillales bacterium]